MASRSSETAEHLSLKQLAVIWACSHGFRVCALEVRRPYSRYRADVAAATSSVMSDHGKTAVFECKASRQDLLRDTTGETEAREQIAATARRLATLRELIGAHCPDLRRGESLFPEFDAVDLRGVRHQTHQRTEKRLRTLQSKLADGVKFARISRYRLASFCYLVTRDEFMALAELPAGWGWLVRKQNTLDLAVKPTFSETTPATRVALLGRIAEAGSWLLKSQFSIIVDPDQHVRTV
jgi:hypothetical protein